MTYTARVKRWEEGWEVHVDGVGVTQTRTLNAAAQQAADLISSYLDRDVSSEEVTIDVDLGGDLSIQVERSRALVRDALRCQQEAAAESRRTARALRNRGLSVSDSAAILGISRGRVSQLVSDVSANTTS